VFFGNECGPSLEVRQRVYVEEFGFDLGGSARDELDARAFHIVATTAAGVSAASLRLVDAANRPFEVENFLDLGQYLAPESHPAEITRLCILAPFRRIATASLVHIALLGPSSG